MANAPLTLSEVLQCKNLLGYPNQLIQANPIIGTSRVFEDILLNYSDDYGIGYIRTVLANVAQLESDMQDARTRFKIDKAEDFTQNPDEFRKYVQARDWWIGRLEQTTGIKRYRAGNDQRRSEVY